MKRARSLWVVVAAGTLLAGCDTSEGPEPCTGEACATTTLELVFDGAAAAATRGCTVVLSTPHETSWTARADVRAALERRGLRAVVSAVQSSGGALPAVLGEIGVSEEEADAVEVVRVECFDGDGVAVESAGASLRRRAP